MNRNIDLVLNKKNQCIDFISIVHLTFQLIWIQCSYWAATHSNICFHGVDVSAAAVAARIFVLVSAVSVLFFAVLPRKRCTFRETHLLTWNNDENIMILLQTHGRKK